MTIGRPPLDREPLFKAICCLTSAGRDLRRVSARKLAAYLKRDRETIGVMLADLEQAGRIRRRKNKGRSGLLVEITDPGNRLVTRRRLRLEADST